MPLSGGQTFAGFRILRLLGSGGMGEVYLAEHPRLPRHNALKVLPADVSADPDYRARFNREADLASKLWHPHIVSVHDRGEHDGQLWISMDYVDGLDAARLLADRFAAGMPTDEVIRIITAVASALDYAHKRGLLHRDVKPANIMLTHVDDDDDEQRILLTDFGIARNIGDISGLTATNMTVGTVAYSAPEQLTGEELDGRADQYALAATAYHLLTGRQLFPHSNPAVVIGRHLSATPPELAGPESELAVLDPVIAVALSKDPGGRFRRCTDFARALSKSTPGASASSAPTIHALASRKPASPAAEPWGRSAEASGSPKRWLLAATLIGVVALTGVFAFALYTRQQRHLRVEQPATSTVIGSPVTTIEPPTSSWIVPPPFPTTTTTTTTAPATSQSSALPQAVVASGCRFRSTPTADPDGYTVYCARIESSDSYIWSRTAGTVPLPTDTSGQPLPGDQGYTYICQQQTGHTLAYCEYEMAHATYRGDGLDPP